ncbi:hypothetical protein GCM10023238_03210 [Streptomyces heliomycini]
MHGRDQSFPQDCPGDHPGMSTEAGIDVQRQLESLIQDFRTSDPPMPVIVLHAEDAADDGRVTELVDELSEGQQRHGTRLAVAPTEPQPGDLDPTARAARLLVDLGDSRKWGDRSASYRPYSFPRLNLVRALQEATDDPEMREHWPTAPGGTPDGNVQRSGPRHICCASWPGSAGAPADPRAGTAGAAQRRAAVPPHGRPGRLHTRCSSAPSGTSPSWRASGLMVLLAGLNHVPARSPLPVAAQEAVVPDHDVPPVRRRRRSTSVRQLRPVRSWRAYRGPRLRRAEAMREGGPFPLQLYVLALFEDLRDNHRRGSWDLRGFSGHGRGAVPCAGGPENGGIELIRAVSDVRSGAANSTRC